MNVFKLKSVDFEDYNRKSISPFRRNGVLHVLDFTECKSEFDSLTANAGYIKQETEVYPPQYNNCSHLIAINNCRQLIVINYT